MASSVFTVVWSLFSGANRSQRSADFRPEINAAKSTPHRPPFNDPGDVPDRFVEIAEARGIELHRSDHCSPYWMQGTDYNPWEVFYTAIQFVDDHDAPLPTTVLPPEKDVEAYLHRVLESDERLLLPDQLELALDVTDNHLIGACNVAFLTSRLLSRTSDFRPYPGSMPG